MRNGSAASNEQKLLDEWKSYFGSLLNNDDWDLSYPLQQQKTFRKILIPQLERKLLKQLQPWKQTTKATVLDCAITAEALQGGGDEMLDAIHAFCFEVYTSLSPPR